MASILALGFLIGLSHAIEADHVAAVSALVARKRGMRDIVRHGAFWGTGHALTLLTVGGAAVLSKTAVGPGFANGIEFVVGMMLVILGADVLWRLWRDKVHFHWHRHRDRVVHMHAHSHRGDDTDHARSSHAHGHPDRSWMRTMTVGVIHGLAGSAALVVLAASTLTSPVLGFGYIAIFGFGSVVGMGLLSAVIAVPIAYSARSLTILNSGMQGMIGVVTIGIGTSVLYQTTPVVLLLLGIV